MLYICSPAFVLKGEKSYTTTEKVLEYAYLMIIHTVINY